MLWRDRRREGCNDYSVIARFRHEDQLLSEVAAAVLTLATLSQFPTYKTLVDDGSPLHTDLNRGNRRGHSGSTRVVIRLRVGESG